MLLKACLNGDRKPGAHPALPISPEDLAADAQRVVEAGAGALHFHPRRSDGSEALDTETVGAAVEAVRAACPNVSVGVSTGAWIEPDLGRRLEFIREWRSLSTNSRPDFASVNLSEAGAVEVCDTLLDSGVGAEAGLWSAEDARLLLESGLTNRCTRLLIELVQERPADEARTIAQRIEGVLDESGTSTPRLLHGEGTVTWPMLQYALERGYDVRVGFEDTLVLPDGRPAKDNAQLMEAALECVKRARRDTMLPPLDDRWP